MGTTPGGAGLIAPTANFRPFRYRSSDGRKPSAGPRAAAQFPNSARSLSLTVRAEFVNRFPCFAPVPSLRRLAIARQVGRKAGTGSPTSQPKGEVSPPHLWRVPTSNKGLHSSADAPPAQSFGRGGKRPPLAWCPLPHGCVTGGKPPRTGVPTPALRGCAPTPCVGSLLQPGGGSCDPLLAQVPPNTKQQNIQTAATSPALMRSPLLHASRKQPCLA